MSVRYVHNNTDGQKTVWDPLNWITNDVSPHAGGVQLTVIRMTPTHCRANRSLCVLILQHSLPSTGSREYPGSQQFLKSLKYDLKINTSSDFFVLH